MQIPCISCQSRFRLDSRLVKATGSLVRCSKCEYIFMVYPPAFYDEPVVKDTNIDQSILDELLKVEKIKRYQGILDKTSDEINNQQFDEIASIKDLEEEEDDQEAEIEDIELAELPDLSEYENMIDWDEFPDEADLIENEKQFYNSIRYLDINET
jgi:predicted Zn finger-like uncharacterized protein